MPVAIAKTKPEVATRKDYSEVLLEVPLTSDPPPSEFQMHIDVKLDVRQSTVLRRMTRELDVQQAKLANGRRVTEATHAFKWLLEKIGEQADK